MIAVLEIIRCAAAVALLVVLAGIDVVMYLVLSVADRHWEKRFENEEDENDESSDSL